MKHDPRLREPDTADLIAVVRLARMTESTRAGTLAAVRLVRGQLGDGEAPVSEVFAALEAPTEAMRAAARGRWTQTASDLRRARRAWDDVPRRTLALELRGRLPNFSDVMAAAPLHLKSDEAKRTPNDPARGMWRDARARTGGAAATCALPAPFLRSKEGGSP